jgi:hypothetical protein
MSYRAGHQYHDRSEQLQQTAGICAARSSRRDHISDIKWQSFVRGGAGGFFRSYTVGRRASPRLKQGSAIGNLEEGAPYASVMAVKEARKAIKTEAYSKLVVSMESQDVASNAKLLQGQAVKHFLNKVKPSHLSKIEHFMKEELGKYPKDPHGDYMNNFQRLSIASTAWQALNDCLPQFRGTLEDIREMYDARVDFLRLSLSFLETEMDIEEDRLLPPVSNSNFKNVSTNNSEGINNNSITNANNGNNAINAAWVSKKRGRRSTKVSSISFSSSTDSTSSSVNNTPDIFRDTREKTAWNPTGCITELRSFWSDVSAHHSKVIKTPGGRYLKYINNVFLPCLMTTYHEITRHITEISRARSFVLEIIWHRSLLLIASICRHAKLMHLHHTKILNALENALKAEQDFLRKNEQAVEYYNHELKPAEMYQQEQLGATLKKQETELRMLRERKNALVRVKNTLESLVAEYTNRRHTKMKDAEKFALENHISIVTTGSLSSAMERQQDRLRKAELASASADLLVKTQLIQKMLEQIKENIRRNIGSSIKRDASVQVDASDQSWTVEVDSSRKMAPSQGWWTLHHDNTDKKKTKKTVNLEQFDLASGLSNESTPVPLPAMFQRVLTLGVPKLQVRPMSNISFYKTVHAIYDSMLEVWEEGGGEVRRDINSGSSAGVKNFRGWDANTTVSDFVYDYLLLQFGIAELSEPKLLQLLTTSYHMRKKIVRAKTFALICGITKPTDRRGCTINNLHDRYHEDALKFYIGAYSAVRNEHSMGRCIEITKKSLYYCELHIAIYISKQIFYTETEQMLQAMINNIKNHHEVIIIEKSMLGIDRRLSTHNVGEKLAVINVDLLLDLWLTKWTLNIANSLNRFKILFVASDVNEDGRLSYREFSTTLTALDPNIESHTIAELFRGCLRKTKQGGAEIDCISFAHHMTRNTDYMSSIQWEGRHESTNNESSSDVKGSGDIEVHDNTSSGSNKSCIQMYGSPSSHKYKDVSRSVRELREEWSRWKGLIQKHLDWIVEHAKTPDEKWDSQHCYKRLGHFETLFEKSLDGRSNAELAWQAYRLLRHETEKLRRSRTMLSHSMAPLHLIAKFKKKMLKVAKTKDKNDENISVSADSNDTMPFATTSENGENVGSEEDNAALAFSSVRWHHVDKLVRMLDFNVIDINIVNHQGNSLLHTACQNGHLDIVRRLCRKQIELNTQNNKGDTAMHFARYYDYDEIFRFLRQQGANDTLRNVAGETCYEKVASSGM